MTMLIQFGALPYRIDPEKGLQVLLVTSRDTGRWVIPRGNRMPGLPGRETAVHESFEEAGIEGEISKAPIGRYDYEKKRGDREPVPAQVTVYSLHVAHQHDVWPEQGQRIRRWFEPIDAAAAVDEPDLKALIREFRVAETANVDAGSAEAVNKEARLLEALPEPALLIENGVVRQANAAARRLLGDWVQGLDVPTAIPHPAAVERLLGPSSGRLEDADLVGLGNSRRRWLMRVAPLDDDALFVRFIDRSEAHAAEQMRVDFVANASHELRTPLATLVGYAETLREQAEELDAPTREQFTAVVHEEARRMQQLVEDLISLSRIEAERFSRPRDALPLTPLVLEARALATGAANEGGSDIQVDAPDDLPPVAGDRSELLQLLDNLISNALRYGRAGAPVRIRLSRDRDMIRLEVADEGEGIAPEHIPRVTERFYRVDPSRSRSLGGTGLGLSIVKHIVERHRGRLSIESEFGRGTTVHVLLPIAHEPVS
jgi:two-component system phosphate regulon sensor histidine kinase PhoR